MLFSKTSRSVLCAIFFSQVIFFSAGTAVAADADLNNVGDYSASGEGNYVPISHDATINTITASGGAKIEVSDGDTVINGKTASATLQAILGGKIIINGNLKAFTGAGDIGWPTNTTVGYSGFVANGGEITLNGKSNDITSLSTRYGNSEAVFFAYNNGRINVSSDYTNVTVGQSIVALAQNDASITFSNGKLGAESSLFQAQSNSQRRMVYANGNGKIYFDRVDLANTSSSNGRMFFVNGIRGNDADNQAKITFLGGIFNKNTTDTRGATALEANNFGQIEALGYEGGELYIRTGGNNEPGIRSLGGAIVEINTTKSHNFKTTIKTANTGTSQKHQHGIAAGSLPLTDGKTDGNYYGAAYADAAVSIYGTADISVEQDQSYGLRVMGDGAKINIYAIDNQAERSKLHSNTTAINFASANGYSSNDKNLLATAGGQVIHLEKMDITNNGTQGASDTNGVYSGHLIQVGSHGQDITEDGHQLNDALKDIKIINVADAVKNATLNLVSSTATASDDAGKDLINVTYGGGSTNVKETFASDIKVNASERSTLTGSIFTDYTLDSSGKASSLDLALTDGSVWNITRNSSSSNDWRGANVTGNFVSDLTVDNSTVDFRHMSRSGDTELIEAQKAESFKTLYVAGNYQATDAKFKMNVVLSDDSSATDKLVVGGDTSGNTTITFSNIGGTGAETVTGIKVVEVFGESNGGFTKENVLVAGLYEYALVKGGNSGISSDWYLTSYIPVTPGPDPDYIHILRPEVGSYLGNMAMAGDMFNLRLYEREAHIQQARIDPDKRSNVWFITSYSNTEQKYGDGQLKGDADLWQMRLGLDLHNKISENNRQSIFGLMASYAHGSQKTKSIYIDRTSKGVVDGFLAGLYGTWFENADTRMGWYIDGWAQYGWFDNEVRGDGLAKESYDSDGWAVSLEFGKSIPYRETSDRRYFWQPKAQLIYSDLSYSDHMEASGTSISYHGDSNLMTRVGLRWATEQKPGIEKRDAFYIEANWIHNTDAYELSMGNHMASAYGAENLGELRLGFEKELSKDWRLWANVTGRWGQDSYRQLQGMLSFEYRFK